MIIHPLIFTWSVSEEEVSFSVRQNPAHEVYARYYSRGKIPPISERVKLCRSVGIPESSIKNMVKKYNHEKKNSEKRQIELDAIFSKFNVKPTKKKILKPVKKL